MKKQPLAVLALALLLGLASCGGEALSSSSDAGASSTSTPSSEPGASSSVETVSSEPSVESSASESSPSEDGDKIPAGLVGVWEGNDGHRYLKLTVEADGMDLNGVKGTMK